MTRTLPLWSAPWTALFVLVSPAPARADAPVWDPARTWVFAISVPYSEDPTYLADREDGALIDTFRAREVPGDHIVFLQDRKATLANIRAQLEKLLARTEEGDFLVFSFQGHGGGSPVCFGTSDDEDLSAGEIFQTIEEHFNGAGVLLLGDCCCSGGLIREAKRRATKLTCTCLASTYAFNPSAATWTFQRSLTAGFHGDPMVDLNGDGVVALGELQRYVEREMAYVEGQKAVYQTFNDFDSSLQISTAGEKAHPRVGTFVEVRWNETTWYTAKIVDYQDEQFKVVYAQDGTDEWVNKDVLRNLEPYTFEEGTEVLARHPDHPEWFKAVVKKVRHGLHFVQFEGTGPDGIPSMWVLADCIQERPEE